MWAVWLAKESVPNIHWNDLREKALFGLIDGLNGAVGLIIGLLHAHAAPALIFIALMARAGSSSVSMAGAQYQADTTATSRLTKWGCVIAMGLGYLTSALIPGLGFAFSTRVGLAIFIPATVLILGTITWYRSGEAGWVKAAATTLVIFVVAVVVGLAASVVG